VNDPDVKLLLVLLLIAGVAGGFWYYHKAISPRTDTPATLPLESSAVEAPLRSGPMHPLPQPDMERLQSGELVALPALDDSDSYFLLALVDAFGADMRRLLANEDLIDKFVATVDSLPRSHVAEKIRPVGRLQNAFVAEPGADGSTLYLGPENFSRYNWPVQLVTAASPDVILDTYLRFYPLFQEAYVRLGYPNAYFNDRVVEVIDHLLQTPTPEEPILLLRPNVLYEFADPELQALSSGQKLLLRMGSENASSIKALLLELRARIAQTPDPHTD